MKILELNFERSWRGGERQTLYNMIGFRNEGHEVALVCRKGCPLEKASSSEGFKIYSFNNVFGVIYLLVTRGYKFDILHAQGSGILTYCILTKPFHGQKVIFSRRVDFVPKSILTKIKYRKVDKIIAISTAIKQIVSDFCKRDDIDIISDIAIAKPLNKQRAIVELNKKAVDRGKYIIATVAALVPHKDPFTLIETIRILASERQDFVFLHFGNGEMQKAMETRIAEYNLESIYILMGFYEDVEDFYSVFNVFAFTSAQEGLGSSILDAFLYNVPVVSTCAGGIIDIINNERGLLCPVKDSACMAKGINNLLNNNYGDTLVNNAHSYVAKYHSLSYITDQYLQVMRPGLNQNDQDLPP